MKHSIYFIPLLVSIGLSPASGQDILDTASKRTVEVPAQYETAEQRSPVNEGAYQRSPVNEGAYQRQDIEVRQYGTVEVPAEYGTVEVPAEYGAVEITAIYLGDDVWQTSDGTAVSIGGAADFGIRLGDTVQIWNLNGGRSEARGGGHITAIIAGLEIWEDEQRSAVVWEEEEGRSEARGGGHITAIIAGLERASIQGYIAPTEESPVGLIIVDSSAD